jgi:class 3 adenylate cyclase
MAALLEAYLGRRSAARVQAGALRRGTGETIRAALLYADLRDFTALSEAIEPTVMIAALDAWFDRVAGAVHAFGGEVLKFIGDGVLAMFPVTGAPAGCARECQAARMPARGRRRPRRHGPSRCGAAGAGAAAAALRRGAASRRDPVGQYRRGRPAGLHAIGPA